MIFEIFFVSKGDRTKFLLRFYYGDRRTCSLGN
jgi:hypothetical protein